MAARSVRASVLCSLPKRSRRAGDIQASRKIGTVNKGTSVFDQGVLACCDPTPPGNLAFNFSAPGTWNGATITRLPRSLTWRRSCLIRLWDSVFGEISSLTDKLNNVLASIQAGLNKQAINQLNAFISSVQAAEKNNKISVATGTTLVTAAQGIIALLA